MSTDARRMTLKLWQTPPHSCPYLDQRIAVTAFVEPQQPIDDALFTLLLQNGFRRSGEHVYRPNCPQCQACQAVRIPVEQFVPSRSQRRALKRNAGLNLAWCDSGLHDEHFALYERYINTRHRDGDMYPADRDQFFTFLVASWSRTRILELRDGSQLLAVMVTDRLLDGYSAVYSFYEPTEGARSPGVQAILSLIACARLEALPYVYLGYYIRDCRKMNYKNAYQPLEVLTPAGWQLLAPEPAGLAEK